MGTRNELDDTPCIENPHRDLWASETFVSDSDRDWERFVAKVENLIGHELDGDMGDGYSLDGANDWFTDGLTPEQYVQEVQEIREAKRS